jgi:hypothetical protein
VQIPRTGDAVTQNEEIISDFTGRRMAKERAMSLRALARRLSRFLRPVFFAGLAGSCWLGGDY